MLFRAKFHFFPQKTSETMEERQRISFSLSLNPFNRSAGTCYIKNISLCDD